MARAGEKPLYQVLEQQAAPVGNALMGSDHTYVIPGAGAAAAAGAPARGAAAAAAKRCGVPDHCALGCFCILIFLPRQMLYCQNGNGSQTGLSLAR